jgi:hypothetical protein
MNLVCENTNRFSTGPEVVGVQWLTKDPSWYKLLQLPDLSWWQLLFAAAGVVVVIWSILRLAARVNEDVDPAEADREMLEALNDLRREGDLTEDEFRSIKGQITGRLKAQWKSLPKAATSAGIASLVVPNDSNAKAEESESENDVEQGIVQPEAAQSNQSETFVRPTNVPDASQDPEHLTKRSAARETEDRFRSSEADSTEQE